MFLVYTDKCDTMMHTSQKRNQGEAKPTTIHEAKRRMTTSEMSYDDVEY